MSQMEDNNEQTQGVIMTSFNDFVPIMRIALALWVFWTAADVKKNPRFYTGVVSAVVCGAYAFALLSPVFDYIQMALGTVALYILTLGATAVAMCLGILLPRPLAGTVFGAVATVLVGIFMPPWGFFPYITMGVSVFCTLLSIRYQLLFLTLSTILTAGAVASCILFPNFLQCLSAVAWGEIYEPSLETHANTTLVIESQVYLGLIWISGTFISLILLAFRQGGLQLKDLFRAPGRSSTTPSTQRKKVTPPSYYQPPSVSLNAFNMFDPADLPPRLAEYAIMVYSACEDLGNFFGFQDSSVRNQAEHLLILLSNNRRYMSNHILPPTVQPPSPIHALHAKVFSNYMKWCRAMGVPPNFSKMNSAMAAPPAVTSRVVDLVLFFCIWGEGSNIRHMPECLWFLYHKMMEEYTLSEGYVQTRSLYAGYFLDHVVTPIYDIVSKSMQSSGDHQGRRNYDDFNEFFWSRKCLRYRYSSESPGDSLDVEVAPGVSSPLSGESFPAITEGLDRAPKTFLEKRSWLRSILALYRIIEWHLVTFYILSVIAFSRELVWGWVYTVQVASGVFWIINSLYLIFGIIEVWAIYPSIQLSASAICGFIFSLSSRFLILVYQTLYLMFTFGPTSDASKLFIGIQGDANFWWWQYVWLSVLCMSPWLLDAIMQVYPALTTKLFISQNEFVQSFLNILFPISRLYTSKEVHESFKHTAVYSFFWITLMAWKLFFSYVFEVYCMVLPTLQLTDDYINYADQSFTKMMLLLTMRWLPQFLVYLIDMNIWYSVWAAFAGTAVGFGEHLGEVRTMADIRSKFGRAPEQFCRKLLSPDAGSRRGSSASFLTDSNNAMGEEGQSLLKNDLHKLQSYMNRLLDVRVQKWVMFSAAWNEIIDYFRQEDIISNKERDCLKFSRFDGFSQAIYLPVFQTSGVVENVLTELEAPRDESVSIYKASVTDEDFFKPIVQHVIMRTAVAEVWELGGFVVTQLLGPLHQLDINAISSLIIKWSENGTLTQHLRMEKLRAVVGVFTDLVKILETGIGKRKPASKPRSSTRPKLQPMTETVNKNVTKTFRRSVSATSLTSMDPDTDKGRLKKIDDAGEKMVIIDALRDQARDKFRAMAHALKGLVKSADSDQESRDILDRLTFLLSMENGFLWDDAYASDQLDELSKNSLLLDVLKKLHGMLATHPDDVEPKSKEVRRRLAFFVNSLFMDMPDAPSIYDMFSWNVMTPYYSEDVNYTKADLEKRTDELGVSTLLYLQTLYHSDWNNFLERLEIKDEEKIWSKKFIDETRRWASNRAQTLSRTVSGMMYFEKALRLLANLERLDEDTTNDLMGEKFGYVVSCQVYGNMKKEQDSKVDDIDQLMHRYPHLRVAYIDSIRLNRAGESLFYSVLVKSDGRGGISEIYRVRLPGNPILGEGKPENQNHAMIFTRGEFLQTIDMNQESYFEEALKMRNCLQEFAKRDGPLPTTILGLREHIFTGSVSSLANYMALQETSFVTLGQRVLSNPLRIRLHYGHPDVFDKLFFITRGGISKSSKGINLSEDIFAGYNNVVRGGQVGFKEYMQVGKGRDVGMSQIYKFEAKLSQGAGEQSLSRDVYRLCHRLDFCRLCSFYFGGIGHYFLNVLTVLTIYCVVYLIALLAIFDLERIGDRIITPMGTVQMLLGGLGLLQTIPLYATLGVERGWWNSLKEVFQVFITGGPLHFMFHIQTKAFYMSQTILVGGAKYRATGRGFVTQHTEMDEQFRFFASSHIYLGVEMATGLVLMGIFTKAGQYFGRTWSLWLASLSFLASPFWFNPLSFEWNVVVSDYTRFISWMRETSGGPQKSWSMWWTEENSHYKSMNFGSKSVFVVKTSVMVLLALGVWYSDLMKADTTLNKPWVSVSRLVIIIFVLMVLSFVFTASERTIPYGIRRTIEIILSLGLIAGVTIAFVEDSDFVRYSIAAYYGIGALCQLGLLLGFKVVKNFYFIHDMVCGHIIFIPLFILAALQLPHHIQTWLLYHNALSSDVVVSNILRYARKSQEASGNAQNEDLLEQVTELRKLLQKQEQMLVAHGLSPLEQSNDANNAISSLSAVNKDNEIKIRPPTTSQSSHTRPSGIGRTVSMSGIDLWQTMSMGEGITGAQASRESMSSYQGFESAPNNYNPVIPMQQTNDFTFISPSAMPPK